MKTITDKQASQFALLVLLLAVFVAVLPNCSTEQPVEAISTGFNSVNHEGDLPVISSATLIESNGHGDDGLFRWQIGAIYEFEVTRTPFLGNPIMKIIDDMELKTIYEYTENDWWLHFGEQDGTDSLRLMMRISDIVNSEDWVIPNRWLYLDVEIDTVIYYQHILWLNYWDNGTYDSDWSVVSSTYPNCVVWEEYNEYYDSDGWLDFRWQSNEVTDGRYTESFKMWYSEGDCSVIGTP